MYKSFRGNEWYTTCHFCTAMYPGNWIHIKWKPMKDGSQCSVNLKSQCFIQEISFACVCVCVLGGVVDAWKCACEHWFTPRALYWNCGHADNIVRSSYNTLSPILWCTLLLCCIHFGSCWGNYDNIIFKFLGGGRGDPSASVWNPDSAQNSFTWQLSLRT